jgi:hypothetical protein
LQQYCYPATSLVPDYLRVGCGLAVTAGPLLALDLAAPVAIHSNWTAFTAATDRLLAGAATGADEGKS